MESGDPAHMQQFFAEDAVWHSSLRRQEFRGRDEIMREVRRQQEDFKLKLKVHDVTASDQHVVALLEMTREGQAPERLVHISHVDDQGKVNELWSIVEQPPIR
jgi:hypothetical protein